MRSQRSHEDLRLADVSRKIRAVRQSDRRQSPCWAGIRSDADCKVNTPTEKCEVSDLTKTFGLQTSAGKFVQLDSQTVDKVRVGLESDLMPTARSILRLKNAKSAISRRPSACRRQQENSCS